MLSEYNLPFNKYYTKEKKLDWKKRALTNDSIYIKL